MFLPLLDTAVASPRVLEPRNKSCFPLTQRTGRRGPVGSSQKPTTVRAFAEMAVARLLWLPVGCPRETLPVVEVPGKASASLHFQGSTTVTVPLSVDL